ncbi:LysE family translocator [Paenibacillus xylaniclasticus]|uniref:LysE family translocator n=1 Tax=Paenibacillus xylaniclasticus TaxID=588083 RepID=UPI000FDA238E|nr:MULTISPECIES: LysE family translocator [Paenibacillus]GFN31785.1 LysE family translocator [Paenibacillus curdlanolyticus]
MLTLHTALTFIGVAAALTVMPGPDILFVIAQSMSRSARSGILVALGLCTGLLVHTSLAALGVSAVVLSSPAAFAIVKWLGAAYLLYLAWKTWPRRRVSQSNTNDTGTDPMLHEADAQAESTNSRQNDDLTPGMLYRRGIWMSVLNPKVSLFFLALLPQFVSTDRGSVPLQMIQLGMLFIVQAIVIFSIASLAAGKLGEAVSRRSEKWNKRLAWIEALIYAALAANLVLLQA